MRFGIQLVAIPSRLRRMVSGLEGCAFDSCILEDALGCASGSLLGGWMMETIQGMGKSGVVVNLTNGRLVISHREGPLGIPYQLES